MFYKIHNFHVLTSLPKEKFHTDSQTNLKKFHKIPPVYEGYTFCDCNFGKMTG